MPLKNNSENPIRQAAIEDLAAITLTEEWKEFPDACRDQFRDVKDDKKRTSPWGRIINGKSVFVVLSYEGETHNWWRLFVDGVFIRTMSEVNVHFGSARYAMRTAEEELLK